MPSHRNEWEKEPTIRAERFRHAVVVSMVAVVITTALTGCGSSRARPTIQAASRPRIDHRPRPGVWTGFGAPIADWQAAHKRGVGLVLSGCSSSPGCYGPHVRSQSVELYEFMTMSTLGPEKRVSAYNQALPDGTSIGHARRDVFALLPPDRKVVSSKIDRANEEGCLLMHVRSAQLQRWFGGAHPRNGVLNIGLDDSTPSDTTSYNPRDTNTVSLLWLAGPPRRDVISTCFFSPQLSRANGV